MSDEATNILLYGDSFIWGLNPDTGKRYKPSERIGPILQQAFGDHARIIEEGLRGRTMFGDNGWFPERDGLLQFGPIFASHLPMDILVIMLGTNDLNSKTQNTPRDIASALIEYKSKINYWCDFMKYDAPEVIIISPPEIDTPSLDAFKEVFKGSSGQIVPLASELLGICKSLDFCYIEGSRVIQSVNADGIHVNPDQNVKLAGAIKDAIVPML